MSATANMLTVVSASVRVRQATLLSGVDLDFPGGETVAIVGPNGAGKSTLLRVLSGDQPCSEGRVLLKGRGQHLFSPRELAYHRAMLSQHVNVTFPFRVEEIVMMGAGEQTHAAAQPLVDAAIEEVGLGALRHRELPTLSGGEQQRAHFARVLVQLACGEAACGPGVLLLDEPTSSLDLRHQVGLLEVAKHRARSGFAVIAVLHDLNLAIRFADRIIVLNHGTIYADGRTVETITAELIHAVFSVRTTVGHDDGYPFVLPQRMHPVDTD